MTAQRRAKLELATRRALVAFTRANEELQAMRCDLYPVRVVVDAARARFLHTFARYERLEAALATAWGVETWQVGNRLQRALQEAH